MPGKGATASSYWHTFLIRQDYGLKKYMFYFLFERSSFPFLSPNKLSLTHLADFFTRSVLSFQVTKGQESALKSVGLQREESINDLGFAVALLKIKVHVGKKSVNGRWKEIGDEVSNKLHGGSCTNTIRSTIMLEFITYNF